MDTIVPTNRGPLESLAGGAEDIANNQLKQSIIPSRRRYVPGYVDSDSLPNFLISAALARTDSTTSRWHRVRDPPAVRVNEGIHHINFEIGSLEFRFARFSFFDTVWPFSLPETQFRGKIWKWPDFGPKRRSVGHVFARHM